jgi:hypothetical protein
MFSFATADSFRLAYWSIRQPPRRRNICLVGTNFNGANLAIFIGNVKAASQSFSRPPAWQGTENREKGNEARALHFPLFPKLPTEWEMKPCSRPL